jgi:hypothetical protein
VTDLEVSAYILNLELDLEHAKASISNLKQKLAERDRKIGVLNSERLKALALKSEQEGKVKHFELNSVNKREFNQSISELCAYLQKQRKTSQDEDSRRFFDGLLETLNKAYDDI